LLLQEEIAIALFPDIQNWSHEKMNSKLSRKGISTAITNNHAV
jgi:hypothetical protein